MPARSETEIIVELAPSFFPPIFFCREEAGAGALPAARPLLFVHGLVLGTRRVFVGIDPDVYQGRAAGPGHRLASPRT